MGYYALGRFGFGGADYLGDTLLIVNTLAGLLFVIGILLYCVFEKKIKKNKKVTNKKEEKQ